MFMKDHAHQSRFACWGFRSQKSTGSMFSNDSKLAGFEKREEFVVREIDKARVLVSAGLRCIY